MPVVSTTLTRRDWDGYEQEHAIKVKSFVELGDEGQWVLDGLGKEDSQVMLALVPAIPGSSCCTASPVGTAARPPCCGVTVPRRGSRR